MKTEKTAPVKTEIGMNFFGRSIPVWCYDQVPEGMKPAATTDLHIGRRVMYKVLTGPDEGKYYTGVVRQSTLKILLARIRLGYEVYIK